MVLGAVVRDERIAALSIAGTGLVLAGAYLASRADRRRSMATPDTSERVVQPDAA
jgi:drug/metabolite transporter (DMT)-like permease